uniref:Uncharacterized protein n=1 Tax=viral metagenome TaxID=1070528 RepID=A0A6C0AF84_9ZZZZ
MSNSYKSQKKDNIPDEINKEYEYKSPGRSLNIGKLPDTVSGEYVEEVKPRSKSPKMASNKSPVYKTSSRKSHDILVSDSDDEVVSTPRSNTFTQSKKSRKMSDSDEVVSTPITTPRRSRSFAPSDSDDSDSEDVTNNKTTVTADDLSEDDKIFSWESDNDESMPYSKNSSSSRPKTLKSMPVRKLFDEDTEDLDNFLISKNIIVHDTLITNDTILFLKASNYLGDIFIIKTDKEGLLSTKKTKSTYMTPVSTAKKIPASMKVNISKCAGSSVCGIAFQCSEEFCFLNKNDSGDMEEVNFTINSQKDLEKSLTKRKEEVPVPAVMSIDKVLAYPIVSMSEIEKNNEETFKVIRTSTIAIHKYLVESIKQDFSSIKTYIKSLSDGLMQLEDRYVKMFGNLEYEYKACSEKMKEFDAIKDPNEENQTTKKELSDLMLLKTLTFDRLMVTLGKFTLETSRDTKNQLLRSSDVYYTGYLTVKEVFDDGLSKDLKKSNLWGLPDSFDKKDIDQILEKNWSDTESKMPSVIALSKTIPN